MLLVELILGAILMALVLLDVFLTVLYARAGTGLLSPYVMTGAWSVFRGVARIFGRRAGYVLSLSGPLVITSMIFIWAALLTVGAALIFHPFLGTGITRDAGATPTDFVSALYAAGNSISIIGASGFSPRTGPLRLLYLLNSFVGMSIISLTLTYLMQIYSALKVRNVIGLQLHLLSARTDDTSELLARIAPEGRFESAREVLAELGTNLANMKETHHFYPVLLYFRFPEPYYAASFILSMALDSAALIESALDEKEYGWLQRSAAVSQLSDAAFLILDMIERSLHFDVGPTRADGERWKRRFHRVIERFDCAGIRTTGDATSGAEHYAELRSKWDGRIQSLARAMLYRDEEVDPGHAVRPAHSSDPTHSAPARALLRSTARRTDR